MSLCGVSVAILPMVSTSCFVFVFLVSKLPCELNFLCNVNGMALRLVCVEVAIIFFSNFVTIV